MSAVDVSAILFDLDGTLIDSRHDLADSVRWIQSQYGVPPSDDTTVGSYIGEGVRRLLERALGPAGAPVLDDAVERFKDFYREHCLDTTRPYDGVDEVLRYFQHKPLAIVTNKPVRITHRILKGLGLSSYFPVVLGGDSVQSKKPHPEPIFLALQKLNIPVGPMALMVGDSALDVVAGKAACIKTCGVYSNIGAHSLLQAAEPDFLIKEIRELMRLFK